MSTWNRPAPRRLAPGLALLSALTLAAVLGVTWSLDHLTMPSSGRLALAMIPVALWSGAIMLYVRLLRTLDELRRRIQLEALAIAFPAAMMLGMGVEYAQKAGFARDLSVGDVWPLMFLLYPPALVYARWKYR